MKARKIPLPRNWPETVKSALLNAISMAQFSLAYTRGWAINSPIARVRLRAENDRLRQEVTLLQEEIRVKDERFTRLAPHKRPHYAPTERLSILELRAARSWSIRHTADVFHVTAATIASWMKRLNEQGSHALVQIHEPVNKFPDFVRYAVQRLRTLCPTLGKVKMAEVLCRAGLHLGSSTIGRILKESPHPEPRQAVKTVGCAVTANRPNHVWHIDLTTVPTGGFWIPWFPMALPQYWPFCWWLAVIIDHYSRRAMGFGVFRKRPTSAAMRAFLGRTLRQIGATPKYLICDQDSIFVSRAFRSWCRSRVIRLRFGAVGKHGSIAVVERFIRTLKNEGTRRILVPLRQHAFRRELRSYFAWYNEHRPHRCLAGKTPNEVYLRLRPANRQPRIEPRKRWPRRSRCAAPQALVAGQPGDRFTLQVNFLDGKRHLPIVSLKRAA